MTTVTTAREEEEDTVECAFKTSKGCLGRVGAEAAKKLGFVHTDEGTQIRSYICRPCAQEEKKRLHRDIERTLRESPN